MTSFFPCPYLGGNIELTDEREAHVAATHPDLLPEHRGRLQQTLADPDEIRRSEQFGNAHLFARWFDTLRGGKHVVVVVVTDAVPRTRHWVITAYNARRLVGGVIVWKRS